jgi:DNA (cytosine-5)-methyltransferase 1
MTFRFGELFCGPGGIALAAKLAKVNNLTDNFEIEHVWSTDYDKDSCNTYRKNICPNNTKSVIHKDIRKLDYSILKDISEIDALAFGFPCNDFSVVGEQKGIDGVYGPLYSFGVEALKTFQPKWFLAENVGGLRNANEGKTFSKILQDLFDNGYSVYPHLYKFNNYGVPQSRQRIIIIGIRKDLEIVFRVPSPILYKHLDISAKNALENPPIPQNSANNELTRQSEQVIKRLKHIKPGENAFTANLPEDLQLNVKGAKISQIYKRLDPSKPAYTITGSGGGGTHVYHWEENRALTNRERARLQTFPDNFEFCGSKESVRKQIGMAVPPMGVKIILEAVLKCFAKINYDSIDCNILPFVQPQHEEIYNISSKKEQFSVFEKELLYQ